MNNKKNKNNKCVDCRLVSSIGMHALHVYALKGMALPYEVVAHSSIALHERREEEKTESLLENVGME